MTGVVVTRQQGLSSRVERLLQSGMKQANLLASMTKMLENDSKD